MIQYGNATDSAMGGDFLQSLNLWSCFLICKMGIIPSAHNITCGEILVNQRHVINCESQFNIRTFSSAPLYPTTCHSYAKFNKVLQTLISSKVTVPMKIISWKQTQNLDHPSLFLSKLHSYFAHSGWFARVSLIKLLVTSIMCTLSWCTCIMDKKWVSIKIKLNLTFIFYTILGTML